MVQKTFSIYADDLSGSRLFIEAGTQHVAAWFIDTITGSIKAFEFFQFEAGGTADIDEVVHEVKLQSKLLGMQMDAAQIIWENAACTCIPSVFFAEEAAAGYLDIVAGEERDVTLLQERFKDYVVLSRYPKAYANAITKHLASGPQSHKFSSLLNKYYDTAAITENGIRVVFYPSRLILAALKSSDLQIIQCMEYSTAEDALYGIMQVCDLYNIPLETTPVVASGFINTGSSLYDTLYRYLPNFEIEKAPDNAFAAEGFAEHPPQYFLSFIQQMAV
jgi:hypothetical protein